MVCPACRYNRCPCDCCAVGRVWYTPDHAGLDTYEPPDTPYDDQRDTEEQAVDMDDEFEIYHELLQSQDNLASTLQQERARQENRQTEADRHILHTVPVTGLAVYVLTAGS